MDLFGVKVLPALDLFRSRGLREDDGMRQEGVQLAQRRFMAVVWFVLRDENDIGWINLGKRLDAGWNGMDRVRKLGVVDCRGTAKPWVDEDGKGSCAGVDIGPLSFL